GQGVGRAAEVPLADAGGGVTELLEPVGHRRLGERQAEAAPAGPATAVELVAEAGRVAAGQEAGPAGGAVGGGDVAVGESHAVLGDGVDVRRRDVLHDPLEPELAPADVVGQEDDDVRLADVGGRGQPDDGGD